MIWKITHLHPSFKFITICYFFLDDVDCLRGAFKDDIAGTNYTTCTLPWIQSMLGETEYNDSTIATCEDSENYDGLFNLGFDFSSKITTYSHSKCPGNLKT